jgi:hypothetical protein
MTGGDPGPGLVSNARQPAQTNQNPGEFSGILSDKSQQEFEECLRKVFNTLDIDHDGSFNKRELIKTVRTHPEIADLFHLPKEIHQEDGTRDAIESFFQRIDHNNDRSITWEEFRDCALEFVDSWNELRSPNRPSRKSIAQASLTQNNSEAAAAQKNHIDTTIQAHQTSPLQQPESEASSTRGVREGQLTIGDRNKSLRHPSDPQSPTNTATSNPQSNVKWIQDIARHVATTSVPVSQTTEPHPLFMNMASAVTSTFSDNDDRSAFCSPTSDFRFSEFGVGSMSPRSPFFRSSSRYTTQSTIHENPASDPAPEPDYVDLDFTISPEAGLEHVESAEGIMERMRKMARHHGHKRYPDDESLKQLSPQHVDKWWEETKDREKKRRESIEKMRDKFMKAEMEICTHKPKSGKKLAGVRAAYLDYERKQKKDLEDAKKKEKEDAKRPPDEECTFQPAVRKRKDGVTIPTGNNDVHNRLYEQGRIRLQKLKARRAEEEKKAAEEQAQRIANKTKKLKGEDEESDISDDADMAIPTTGRTEHALRARNFLLRAEHEVEE